MDFSIKNLFVYQYWFTQPYVAYGLSLWLLVGGFLGLIIAGMAVRIALQFIRETPVKSILKKASGLALLMGLWGIMWMFFRQEQVFFLAWRFWLLLWWTVLIYKIVRLCLYAFGRLPKIMAEKQKTDEIKKYLPKAAR